MQCRPEKPEDQRMWPVGRGRGLRHEEGQDKERVISQAHDPNVSIFSIDACDESRPLQGRAPGRAQTEAAVVALFRMPVGTGSNKRNPRLSTGWSGCPTRAGQPCSITAHDAAFGVALADRTKRRLIASSTVKILITEAPISGSSVAPLLA